MSPAQFSTENGLHAHHLPGGEADLYLENQNNRPFDLVLIRKGAWKAPGQATLYDPQARPSLPSISRRKYPSGNGKSSRCNPGSKAPTGSPSALPPFGNVKGGSFVTWDIVTSEPLRAVFSTPDHQGLQFVTPYLYCLPQGDTDSIQLELTGEGEGFKKAESSSSGRSRRQHGSFHQSR